LYFQWIYKQKNNENNRNFQWKHEQE
jgi:hypothetical protein